MRRQFIALSALALATALIPVGAQAQSTTTRSTEIPGNQPIAAYSMQQRDFMRSYVRARPASEFQGSAAVGMPGSAQGSAQTSASSVSGANNGGNIALGANVPSSTTLRQVEGNAAYGMYRYGRMGSQYVIVDSQGRILDTFE